MYIFIYIYTHIYVYYYSMIPKDNLRIYLMYIQEHKIINFVKSDVFRSNGNPFLYDSRWVAVCLVFETVLTSELSLSFALLL